MSATLNGLMTQYASAVKARGATPVILRAATQTSGPNPVPMPPICENPEVAALTAIHSTTLSISAAACNGALIAGDKMTIAGNVYTITGTVQSNTATPGFTNVPITPGLLAAAPAATPIAFTFSLDQPVYVNVGAYSLGLIDGTIIRSSDLMMTLAAWNLLTGTLLNPPDQTDQIIFNGQQLSIISITPKIVLGTVLGYVLQARA